MREMAKKKSKGKGNKKTTSKKSVTRKPAVRKTVPSRKIKVLAYCDSPTCATGFGTVSRNIFEGLQKAGKYDIDILGINYWGDPHNFPYRIWPTGTNKESDPYGRQKTVNMIPRMDFDILFFMQDSFILNFLPALMPHLKQRPKPFTSICYYPVDSIIKEKWANNINHIDTLVAYCEFGKQETLKVLPDRTDIQIIPHGVNTREYFPVAKDEIMKFRNQYFGPKADHFIVTNLNRNQPRKDIPRTIMAFKKFKEIVPNSLLYLHMAVNDQGWNLGEVCKNMGFDTAQDVIFPQNFGPNQGYPREVVNLIYNASDVVTSTTLGEGFGLAWIEAMAARVPIVMPNNTAMSEFITEDKGYLVNSGSNSSLYTVIGHDNEVLRYLTDVDDLVDKWLHVYNNREEAKQKAENAYKWVTKEMDWQKGIVPRWMRLFDRVYMDLQKKDEKVKSIIDDIGQKDSNVIETEEI